jgi:DNA-binding beta-propeller fold protein YncE
VRRPALDLPLGFIASLFFGSLALASQRATAEFETLDSEHGDALVHREQIVDPSEAGHLLMGAPGSRGIQVGGSAALGAPACNSFTLAGILTGVEPEGDLPTGMVFTPDGSKILISHLLSKNVVIVDAATRVGLGAIDVSGTPQGLAVSSDGVHIVTANLIENSASILSLTTGLEIAVIPVGTQPGVVRITPDGLTAVVGNTVDNSLSVIDIATATELHRIPGAGFSASISLSPENGQVSATFSSFEMASNSIAVVPDYWNDEVDFFDIVAGTVTSVASVANPRGVSITPNGATAVVSHYFPETSCSVIDVATKTITKNINVGTPTFTPIAIRDDGSAAVCSIQNAAVVVNLVTNAVSASLNTASNNEMYTTANGDQVICVGFRGSLIDFASQSLISNLNNQVSCAVGAVSPVGTRAAMAATQFGEDLIVMNTNPAGPSLEGQVLTGPPGEADKTRRTAISADGTIAVTTNILSDNATVVDLATNSVIAVLPAGNRPSGVAITPDGTKAVVANLDSTFLSLLDLVAMTSTPIGISTRASEVEISPNGQYAYVPVVTSDGVWRVDLNAMSVAGPKLSTGNMGNTYTFLFGPSSGIALSHDGGTLAVCGSFTDNLTLIDTASWSVVATVPVPAFPFRAVFSADDSQIFVSCKVGDRVVRVSNAGAGSTQTGTLATGPDPFEMAISDDGSVLYLAEYGASALTLIDTASFTVTNTVALGLKPQGLVVRGSCVTISGGNWSIGTGPNGVFFGLEGSVLTVDAQSLAITQNIVTNLPPSELHLGPGGSYALIPTPMLDGLLRLDFEEDVITAVCFGDGVGMGCPCGNIAAGVGGCANSTGTGGTMAFGGSPSVSNDTLSFVTTGLPASTPGLYFQGITNLNGGLGNFFGDGLRCAGGQLIRFGVVFSSMGQSDYPGAGDPAISMAGGVGAGDTRIYQLWYRDPAGPCGTGFNVSQALVVDWQN